MIILNKENFEEEVKNHKGLIVVDFWSEKCESCMALTPEIETLADRYKTNFKFCKLDTTKARRLAIKEKVLGLPTIAIYKDGEKLEEVIKDDATISNIEVMIKKYI